MAAHQVLPVLSQVPGGQVLATIEFLTADGMGIPLDAAAEGDTYTLIQREMPIFPADVATKFRLLIQATGHPAYRRQVNARRANRTADSISLGVLATKIAQEMKEYMTEYALRFGEVPLAPANVLLTKLYRVTQGSWQPEFVVRVIAED